MKRLILLLLAFTAVTSFADTIVFRMKYKGRKFEKKNEGNEKVRNIREAYMVFDYNSSTFEITDVTVVQFWKQDGQKMQQTSSYTGSAYTALVNSGRRTFMTMNNNTDTTKEFMVLIEPNRMLIRKQYANYPIPASVEGTSISQVTNELGERTFQSSSVKGKIHKRWTLNIADRITDDTGTGGTSGGTGTFGSQDVATTVSAIEQQLQDIGYSKIDPKTQVTVAPPPPID